MSSTGEDPVLRESYPLGFHAKGMDGRVDAPKAGCWMGRGLWTAYAGPVMWHIEGGKGQVNKLMRFQVRPSPLDKQAVRWISSSYEVCRPRCGMTYRLVSAPALYWHRQQEVVI